MTDKIIVTIQGAQHSGKGHVMAAVTRKLEELGCNVFVQLAETHNRSKLEKSDEELAQRLSGVVVLVMEQQTA